MRRKKERSKQSQTNNKAKQHSTPKAVTFPRKNELPQVGLEPTTLYTLDRALYQLSYRGSSAGWAQTCTCMCMISFKLLPFRYVGDGVRKRYHSALRSLEMAVDRIAIVTTSLADSNVTRSAVSVICTPHPHTNVHTHMYMYTHTHNYRESQHYNVLLPC